LNIYEARLKDSSCVQKHFKIWCYI